MTNKSNKQVRKGTSKKEEKKEKRKGKKKCVKQWFLAVKQALHIEISLTDTLTDL